MSLEEIYNALWAIFEPLTRKMTIGQMAEFDSLVDLASRKMREHVEKLEKYSHFTVRSYCGKISDAGSADMEAKKKVAMDHILECDKRPELQLIDHGIDLLNALRSVCDWEEEYRTINDLGSKAPAPFDVARELLNGHKS